MLEKLFTPTIAVLALGLVGGTIWYSVARQQAQREKIVQAYDNWNATRKTSDAIFERMHDSKEEKRRDFLAFRDLWSNYNPYDPPGVNQKLAQALQADRQLHLDGAEKALGVFRNSTNPMKVFTIINDYRTRSQESAENVESVVRALAPNISRAKSD